MLPSELDVRKIQEDLYNFPYHYIDFGVKGYDFYYNMDYLSCINKIIKIIGHDAKLKILDMGCGDGRLLYELSNMDHMLYGVDYSERAIGFAKAFNPYITYNVGDITKIDLGISFDIIILMEVLEHIDDLNVQNALSTAYNHLKDNGRLIITVPTTNLDLIPKHKRHYNEKSLRAAVNAHFQVLEIIPHSNTGFKLDIFKWIRFVRNMSYPLKGYLDKLLVRYYKRFLENPSIDDAGRLIMICKKSKTNI